MLVPVWRARARVPAADPRRSLARTPLAFLSQRSHLRGTEIRERLARELVRPLERRAVLVLVRVNAGEVGIAP